MYSYRGSYNYGNSYMGMLAGMSAGMMVVVIALIIFGIVCMWRIFEKAGEAGWKSLIPIYNAVVFYRIAWTAKVVLYMILGGVLVSVLSGLAISGNSGAMGGIAGFLMIAFYISLFVVSIITMVKLARRFGKGGGFAVGLILLSIVFLAILAFDSSVYDKSLA